MIGSEIRRNYKRIVERVLKKLFDREDLYDVLPPRKLEKIIDVTTKIGRFLLNIVFFLAISTVFLRIILPKAGFESTIVFMLVVIIFVLRAYMEASAKNEQDRRY